MKSLPQRLNNIIGQIEGVKRMMAGEKECVEVLTQLKAVRSAVSSVINSVIEEQFDNCLKNVKGEDKKLLIKVKNYVKSN